MHSVVVEFRIINYYLVLSIKYKVPSLPSTYLPTSYPPHPNPITLYIFKIKMALVYLLLARDPSLIVADAIS